MVMSNFSKFHLHMKIKGIVLSSKCFFFVQIPIEMTELSQKNGKCDLFHKTLKNSLLFVVCGSSKSLSFNCSFLSFLPVNKWAQLRRLSIYAIFSKSIEHWLNGYQ